MRGLKKASASEADRSVRKLAADILVKVDVDQSYADVLLDQVLNRGVLDSKDRALLTEIVCGTLRWRGRIDAYLRQLMRRPIEQTDPFITNLLRSALYQIRFLARIPHYAAVNESVDLAKRHAGSKVSGFVNGVLRSFQRMEKDMTPPPDSAGVQALADFWSHPQWMIRAWIDYFGRDEITGLLDGNNRQAPLALRVNTRRTGKTELIEKLRAEGLEASASPWAPQGVLVRGQLAIPQIPGFQEGLFQVQAESSQLVAHLLDAKPGEDILDACAAPGGKTTHIAELMEDRGRIVATDLSARGVARIRENAGRLGHRSIVAVVVDPSAPFVDAPRSTYDRVLVDAPCSGLGTLRSHPEIKWNRGPDDVKRLQALQKKLLAQAAGQLKTGGILVYSTCTLTRAENEDVARHFLGEHENFVLEEAARYLPDSAKELVRDKYLLTLPHRHGTDGFFAARMRKVE